MEKTNLGTVLPLDVDWVILEVGIHYGKMTPRISMETFFLAK